MTSRSSDCVSGISTTGPRYIHPSPGRPAQRRHMAHSEDTITQNRQKKQKSSTHPLLGGHANIRYFPAVCPLPLGGFHACGGESRRVAASSVKYRRAAKKSALSRKMELLNCGARKYPPHLMTRKCTKRIRANGAWQMLKVANPPENCALHIPMWGSIGLPGRRV